MNICLVTMLGLALSQSQPMLVQLQLVDEQSNPIEGVYVHVGNTFTYSNSEGRITLSATDNGNDTISFSHLSYEKQSLLLREVMGDSIFRLKTDVRKLPEVIVSNLDEKEFVKEAIGFIPSNYSIAFDPHLYLSANILWQDNSADSTIIRFKGGLMLSRQEGKDVMVAKNNYEENVAPQAEDFIYTVKPSNFTTIIPISAHPVVRNYKKYDFYRHEYVLYKGAEAVKVHFKIDRRLGGQQGFLIINRSDKAIVSICYSIYPIKNWIGEKTKKGFAKTNLEKYFVEADYSKDASDKYAFDSGRENIQLTIDVGKRVVQTTSDTYLKRTVIDHVPAMNYVDLKELF